ncbi:MAG: putative 2OG-Fe(II) oxygenase [Rhodospirillaceae bacterium]
MSHVQPEIAEDLLDTAWGLLLAGRSADAERLYERASLLRPEKQLRAYWPLALGAPGAVGEEWATAELKRADLHINYLQIERASDILKSVTRADVRPQLLLGHARIALARGAAADALALAGQARTLAPQSPYAAVIYGTALLAAGRSAEAIAPLQAAAEHGRGGAWFLIGLASQRIGKPIDAAAAYRRAYEFDPSDFGPANNLMPALMEAQDYTAAVEHADMLLAAKPGHTTSLAYKYVALAELGRSSELRAFNDYDSLLKAERIAAPSGYKDLGAFHRALVAEIAAEPTLAYERNTTRFGYQTDDVGASTSPAIRALNAALGAAVARRADQARRAPMHAFDRAVPRDFRLYSWGVIIRQKGHQAPHFHPHGWLSGVYYVEVPDDITETDPARSGWIEFGRGDERWNKPTTEMPIRQVKPEAGVLLTFPSYFWHNTRPLRTDKRRVSFAFDAIPM